MGKLEGAGAGVAGCLACHSGVEVDFEEPTQVGGLKSCGAWGCGALGALGAKGGG